jgi:hypothetical protein
MLLPQAEFGKQENASGHPRRRFAQRAARLNERNAGRIRRSLLERFRAKWLPVRVKKTRQIKKLESFTVSVKR